MARLTSLDERDVAAIARGFGLGAVLAATPIVGGTISSNYAFDLGAARVFVRLNDGKDPAVVAWETALVDELAAAGVPTPRPCRTAVGDHVLHHRGLAITAFPWLAGAHLAPAQVTPVLARALGRALAELHLAGLALPADRRRAGIYQFADIARRFDGFRASADPALAPAITILADELTWLTAQAPVRAAASHGLIHNDLFRDNVLWAGDRLIAILDFEQAAGGSLAYDLAVVLNDWCWIRGPAARSGDSSAARTGASPRRSGRARSASRPEEMDDSFHPAPNLAAAVLAGYQDVRPLTAADRAALPVEVRAAAARFTITRITDVYLRQLDTPDKDFRAFLARVVAWRGPELGELLSSV